MAVDGCTPAWQFGMPHGLRVCTRWAEYGNSSNIRLNSILAPFWGGIWVENSMAWALIFFSLVHRAYLDDSISANISVIAFRVDKLS